MGLVEWEALGTTAVLALAMTDDAALVRARAAVERELDRIDRACSRFRADSDLSRANARAGRYAQVDPLLVEALEVALRAARITEGDVDPTVGVALELAGYDRDWSQMEQSPRTPAAVLPSTTGTSRRVPFVRAVARPGWEAIAIDRARCAVRVPRGCKLDLGSTAKAWAADRAARAAYEAAAGADAAAAGAAADTGAAAGAGAAASGGASAGAGALVSLGGDISMCGDPPPGGWTVHVTDDHRAGLDAPGQRIALHGGGLATSSVAVRRWRHEGGEMHHIIDPRSGLPANGPWRTVSVAAHDCVDANIASTAALVRGDGAQRWLEELKVPARLVSHAGETLTVGGWPEEQARIAA